MFFRYWLEQGQIHFPRHQFTEQLRRLIAGESLDSNNGHHGGASEVVGGGDNNNPTAEEGGGSPTDSDHDSSVLWSGGNIPDQAVDFTRILSLNRAEIFVKITKPSRDGLEFH